MNTWFGIEDVEAERRIRFQDPHAAQWDPEVLAQQSLKLGDCREKTVVLAGKAPLWMYGHAAVLAVRSGASAVQVVQPHELSPVQVHPLVADATADPGWLTHRDDPSGGSIVEFQAPPPGCLWAVASLPALASSAGCWSRDVVTLTGKGPNWLYAAAACLAEHRGTRLVSYYSPRDGQGILLTPLEPDKSVTIPPSPVLVSPAGKAGTIIGVLGDPNSGKSVFSILLELSFREVGLKPVWRVDCDHQAPTPHWYLQMLEQHREKEAKDLREPRKREWTAEAEKTIARQLEHCSRSLRWTIADLPGGIKGPPPVRVPPGREVLLKPVDRFVILARADRQDVEMGWREALRAHGLERRICAVVHSAAPDEPLSLRFLGEGDPLVLAATGLDRTHLEAAHLGAAMPQWARLATHLAHRIGS